MAQAERTRTAGTGRGGVLTGSVVTRDGWPVPHAVVTVVDAVGGQVGRSPVGGDGRFAVAGLRPGTYTVITAAAGHTPAVRTGVVNGQRTAELGRLVLAPAGGIQLPAPGTWEIDSMHSSVAATAVHLGFSRIHGRFREFSGTVTVCDPLVESSVAVVLAAASIETGNAERDAHLRSSDFLDVAAFPEIRYVGRGLRVARPDAWVLEGRLTMKDTSRPVPLAVSYLGTGADGRGGIRAGFTASAQLDRDDFGMIWNQSLLAGVFAVGRTLRVQLDVEAVRQE